MEKSTKIPYGESVWSSAYDNSCYTSNWERSNGKGSDNEQDFDIQS